MLNVFTSQGAPFPVMSTQGRFVTAAAILIGLLSLPVPGMVKTPSRGVADGLFPCM